MQSIDDAMNDWTYLERNVIVRVSRVSHRHGRPRGRLGLLQDERELVFGRDFERRHGQSSGGCCNANPCERASRNGFATLGLHCDPSPTSTPH